MELLKKLVATCEKVGPEKVAKALDAIAQNESPTSGQNDLGGVIAVPIKPRKKARAFISHKQGAGIILKIVAEELKLSIDDVIEGYAERPRFALNVSMYFIREYLGLSLKRIAEIMGRVNHNSSRTAIKAITGLNPDSSFDFEQWQCRNLITLNYRISDTLKTKPIENHITKFYQKQNR